MAINRRKPDGFVPYWFEDKDGRTQITIQFDTGDLKIRLGAKPVPKKIRGKRKGSAKDQVGE